MTLSQKQDLYRRRFTLQNEEISQKEWESIQASLIRWTGCGLVVMTILLFWVVGGK